MNDNRIFIGVVGGYLVGLFFGAYQVLATPFESFLMCILAGGGLILVGEIAEKVGRQ